jgi:hypothetical protein
MEVPLSQSPKKPGARDISDLKARLGLKKGGPAAKPKPPGAPGQGAAIPPPTRGRGAVPAPPGAAPLPGAAGTGSAPIPDASKDPFGAMNAMAAQRVAHAAPEIIVVNDGRPVESVEKKARGALLVRVVLPMVAALVVGVVVGQMGTRAKIYNETIDDAGKVSEIVAKVDKDLQNLRNALYTAKEKGANGQNYLVADTELADQLEALQLTMPDLATVYESNLYEMEQGVVDQTMAFLTESTILYKDIKEHVEKTRREAKALVAGQSRLQKFGLPSRYGVIVDIEKGDDAEGKPVSATFVELGDPVCGDNKPNPAGCGDAPPSGFMYRPAELGPWGQKSLAVAEGQYVPGNRLIPLGFDPSPTLKALFQGGEATVSEVSYMQRITDIDAKVDDLMERAKGLRKSLTTTANASKQFTFFL